MDSSRILELIESQIECCRQGVGRYRALDESLALRDGEELQAWSARHREGAARLRDLNRRLEELLRGQSLSEYAQTLPQAESESLLGKCRELTRVSADWRLANARSFRFLQRTASASQSMLEQVFGLAGGYDSRGNMMNSFRSSH